MNCSSSARLGSPSRAKTQCAPGGGGQRRRRSRPAQREERRRSGEGNPLNFHLPPCPAPSRPCCRPPSSRHPARGSAGSDCATPGAENEKGKGGAIAERQLHAARLLSGAASRRATRQKRRRARKKGREKRLRQCAPPAATRAGKERGWAAAAVPASPRSSASAGHSPSDCSAAHQSDRGSVRRGCRRQAVAALSVQAAAADWAGWLRRVIVHREAGRVHQRRRAVHMVDEDEHCEAVDDRLRQMVGRALLH